MVKNSSTTKTTTKNKAVTLRRLSNAVFDLEHSKGHLKWKVTELVRIAKVSRSLIYAYLGSSKKEILLSALQNFIAEFYGFDSETNTLPLAEQVRLARARMIQYPNAILFYQKWRSTPSWLQNEFIEVEQRFQKNLRKQYPNLSVLQTLTLHASIHGLVTAPFLQAEQSYDIFQKIWGAILNPEKK